MNRDRIIQLTLFPILCVFIAQSVRAIEDGSLHPSLMNGGTVRVTIYDARNSWPPKFVEDCSGQVISRDSILTSAHCFLESDAYEDGLKKDSSVVVTVQHQNPDGSWERLHSSTYEVMDVYIRKEYIEALDEYEKWKDNPLKSGYDIAVLQRSSRFSNINSKDVAAIVRYTSTSKPVQLSAYGHGLSSPTLSDDTNPDIPGTDDDQLRNAQLIDFSWHNSKSNYPRTIEWFRD